MKPTPKHFVRFLSPGTFFDEQSERSIADWDIKAAIGLSETIEERYGAKPYGFVFETRLIAEDIDDGYGGKMRVEPKTIKKSGVHFINGKLKTLDQLEAAAVEKEEILRTNMRMNDWPIAVFTVNRYTSCHPFEEKDCVVNLKGEIVERGDDPKHVAYRAQKKAEKRY